MIEDFGLYVADAVFRIADPHQDVMIDRIVANTLEPDRWLGIWRHHPWELEDVLIEDGERRMRCHRLPVFAEHITVPPHVAVTTPSHEYSCTERGTDLCFHSPEALPDGSTNLATCLGKFRLGS